MVKAWKIILAVIVFAIISQVIHGIGVYLEMDYYLIEEYFPVWSKIMMPAAGPPPTFYIYSIGFAVITGFFFMIVYGIVRNSIPGKTAVKKGLNYGFLIFLVGGLPGYLALILLINLPAILIVYWAIEGLITNLINGAVIA